MIILLRHHTDEMRRKRRSRSPKTSKNSVFSYVTGIEAGVWEFESYGQGWVTLLIHRLNEGGMMVCNIDSSVALDALRMN